MFPIIDKREIGINIRKRHERSKFSRCLSLGFNRIVAKYTIIKNILLLMMPYRARPRVSVRKK